MMRINAKGYFSGCGRRKDTRYNDPYFIRVLNFIENFTPVGLIDHEMELI